MTQSAAVMWVLMGMKWAHFKTIFFYCTAQHAGSWFSNWGWNP